MPNGGIRVVRNALKSYGYELDKNTEEIYKNLVIEINEVLDKKNNNDFIEILNEICSIESGLCPITNLPSTPHSTPNVNN